VTPDQSRAQDSRLAFLAQPHTLSGGGTVWLDPETGLVHLVADDQVASIPLNGLQELAGVLSAMAGAAWASGLIA
jgi:hypothetical protein